MIQKGTDPNCTCNWGLSPFVSFSAAHKELAVADALD